MVSTTSAVALAGDTPSLIVYVNVTLPEKSLRAREE